MHSLIMKFKYITLALAFLTNLCVASTFEVIKDPVCPKSWANMNVWTVGEQYVDSNNGVVQDSYSMLVRWQGANFQNSWVSYDIGKFTGLHTSIQRGLQPEDTNGSPGVQLSCYDVGMLLNSWETPHRPIVGGGYNNMWGYAWSAANRVRPFVKNGVPTELVLQANIAVPIYSPTRSAGSTTAIVGVVGMYAYLRDTTHPDLNPIVMLAMSHDSFYDSGYNLDGAFLFDYSKAMTQEAYNNYPSWFQGQPSTKDGVWYSSGPINTGSTNPYVTTRYTQGNLNQPLPPTYNPAAPMLFWRAHITQQNLINLVNKINTYACTNPCPAKGYSTNPADYVLEYAGIIAEAGLFDNKYDISPTNWIVNDSNKDQVVFGVHANGFGVYRYLP